MFGVLDNSGSLFVEEGGGVRVERFVEFVEEGFEGGGLSNS